MRSVAGRAGEMDQCGAGWRPRGLGRALSSVRDYLLLVANEGLQPALQAKGNASDLVQETFLQAQRGVQQFRGRTASEWRHWLRSILIRNIAQEHRRFAGTAKRELQREVTVPESLPLEEPGNSKLLAAIWHFANWRRR